MTNHNNIYNILGKLNSLAPAAEPKKESVLKTLNEHAPSRSLVRRLNEKFQESKQTTDEDLLAKKDYDGDGKKESPKDEYMGSKDKAIKKATGKRDLTDESAKPDYIDIDKDGDKKEPMKKAAKEVDEGEEMPNWVRHPEDPKSKIPAYRRKAADPGRMSAADAADEKNKNAGAKVWRSGRPTDMEEDIDEGFPTVADARKRAEQERGTGKFDSQKTGTGTRYTRKSDTFSDDGDSAETSGTDAPKKRGRPAKNKGPERTTSKAWKHKGSRKVAEHINLETVVEETLQELDDLLIMERSVSKAQFRTMAAASHNPDFAKKVGIDQDVAQEFHAADRKQSYKKLPQKVDEALEMECSDPGLRTVCSRYGKEVKDFMFNGNMDPDLYHALHDYYYDEMPASVKRGADTEGWVSDRFHSDMGGPEMGTDDEFNLAIDGEHDELNSLAKLAGLHSGGHSVHESSCNMTAEGEYCPEHGLAECGMGMYEGKKIDQNGDGKNDFTDVQIARYKASGEAEEKVDEEYANEPEEKYFGVDVINDQGDDLNKKKKQDPKTANKAANPLEENSIVERLRAMYTTYEGK